MTTQNDLVVSFANVDAIASKFSDELLEELHAQSEAKARIKRGAAWLMFTLIKDFGEDKIAEFPRVGSKHKAGANIVSDMNPEPKKNKDGTTGETQVSFYAKAWDVSKSGVEYWQRVQAWDDQKDTHPDTIYWEIERARLTAERSNEINKLKEAMKLFQRIYDVNDFITDAQAKLAIEGPKDNRRPVAGHQGIILKNTVTDVQKRYTTGQFLALNLAKAIENGATYEALVATTGKGSGAAAKVFCAEIKKVTEYDEVTSRYHSYLKHAIADKNEYKKLMTHLNEAGSDALILSMHGVMVDLEHVLGAPGIARRLETLIEAGGESELERRANGGVPMAKAN
jgi:hypothetical protein